ncbi:DNA-protecting protein DprA [Parahaliea maris]|uniref:DNA-protecting protein DprA n=1 Tax=Parahaliea maris TaxID=2716870 RepID=A0A5C8ZYM8_9GAMM|nr:DNA-processing protein DprA [Parahaliea maris]TXS93703.1 DNA-protecting protein DprA [Parahaliea maris]
MDVETLRRALLLQALPGLSARRLYRLLRQFGGIDNLWGSDPARWQLPTVPRDLPEAFLRLRDSRRSPDPRFDTERQLAALLACEARLLTVVDGDYPALLQRIYDPPPLLYCRGDVAALSRPQLAIVGARRASHDALRAAAELSRAAAVAGWTVTSGLALGIDGAAHRAALEAGGSSVGVMATGIEQVYPRRHRDLGEALVRQGALITEFAPGCGPLPEHFPRRNRIVSGLAPAVLVVEAALPSGSLITAGTALEQGREVFTLPWSIFHPGGAGCLRLLRDGAALIQGPEDLLGELALLACGSLHSHWHVGGTSSGEDRAPAEEDPLLILIGDGAATAEELVVDSGLPLARVLARLSGLELEGRVRRAGAGYSRV